MDIKCSTVACKELEDILNQLLYIAFVGFTRRVYSQVVLERVRERTYGMFHYLKFLLQVSNIKCKKGINFSPIFTVSCQVIISHKDPYTVLFGPERFAYLDFYNITAMTHSLNETSFTSAKRHPHFDERLTCLDNAPGTHFNR